MILVVGGIASGKRTYARSLGFTDSDMSEELSSSCAVLLEVQELVRPEDADEAIRAGVAAHPGYLDNGRIALLYIQNLVKQGRLDEAEALLLKVPEVADMREGEVSTSAVWIELYREKIAREEGGPGKEIPAD